MIKYYVLKVVAIALITIAGNVVASTYMATYPNWDAPGNDYNVVETNDLSRCKSECNYSSRCVAFTLNRNSRKCWLKSTIGSFSRTNGRDDVVLGVKTIRHANGVDRSGMDYRSFTANSVENCSQTCYQENKCRSFTYNKTNNICYLKRGVPNPVGDGTALSGVK
jgi:hypothetical protein